MPYAARSRPQNCRRRAAAGALLSLLVACSAAPAPTSGSGEPADPAFRYLMRNRTLDGAPLARTGPAGVTVVVFFASWCGACRRELGVLNRVRQRHPDVRFIGVNAYEEWRDRSDQIRLREFVSARAPWLEVVRADRALLAAFGGVPKVPTVFVYDREGTQVAAYRRDRRAPPSAGELERTVTAAERGTN